MWARNIRQFATTTTAANKSKFATQDGFAWFLPVQTRWKDNDMFGHVNNAVYHSIFDSIINIYLIRHSGRSSGDGGPVGFMVHTECDYMRPIAYPDVYLAGMSVSKIGNSSVTYKTGIFELKSGEEYPRLDLQLGHFREDIGEALRKYSADSICVGSYTHVFVDPAGGNKPVKIPQVMRKSLERISVSV